MQYVPSCPSPSPSLTVVSSQIERSRRQVDTLPRVLDCEFRVARRNEQQLTMFFLRIGLFVRTPAIAITEELLTPLL
jgi:hypothetical protein